MRRSLFLVVLIVSLGVGAAKADASTCTWNGANANWTTSSDWSCTVIPGSGDDVVINSGVVHVAGGDQNARSLTLGNGALSIDDHSLTVSSSGSSTIGGFLSVAGTLTLNDPTAYAGSQNSNGINVDGTLNIGSTFTMSGVDGNSAGTPDQINNSGLVHVLSGGSLIRDTSSGTVTITPSITNDGTIAVDTGTLRLGGGGSGGTGSSYTVHSGATLQIAGGGNTFESPSISPPPADPGGTFDVAGATATVGAADTFTLPTLNIDGNGTFTLNRDLSIPNLVSAGGGASAGGFRNGTGTLTVTSAADFSDLHLDAGTTTIAASVPSFDISRFLGVASGATLNLDRATTYAGSSDSNGINVDGTLNIASSFTISGVDGSGGGTPGQINNSGVVHVLSGGSLIRDTSSGTVTIGPAIDNDGTVSIQTGTLANSGGLTQAGGLTTVASGAVLSGTVTLNGGTLGGNGTLAGPVTNGGGTVAPGSSPGTLAITGDYSQGSGGTLAEEITGTTPGTQFDELLVGGTLTLGGTLAIDSSSFTPASTDAFKIISGASSRTGTFATVTGASAGGATYNPQYDAGGVTLLVTGAPPPPNQTLSVSFAGTGAGSVSDGTVLNCTASCQHQYPQGTAVTLTATAASGSMFAGWSGGGCSGTGSCQVTLSAAQSVTATFSTSPPVTHTVTVTTAGTGSGTVSSSPSGIGCGPTCSASYAQGTTLTLAATPASGSTFAGWSGACSGTAACTLTITGELSVTATFALVPVVVAPPAVSGGNLFCGVQHRGRCLGLKLKTTFSGPGNAVWQFAAYNPSPGRAGAGASTAKVLVLGTITRKITKAGRVTLVFKLAPGARTNTLYKQIVRLKLKAIRVTLTFTTAAGKRLIETKTIRLTR